MATTPANKGPRFCLITSRFWVESPRAPSCVETRLIASSMRVLTAVNADDAACCPVLLRWDTNFSTVNA